MARELNVYCTAARTIDEAILSVVIEVLDPPPAHLEAVDLSSVESIRLHGNQITSLAHSLHAPNLTSLNLSSNDITVLDGAALASLPQLMVLDLSSNAISRVVGLTPLTALTELCLRGNQLQDINWLAAFHDTVHRLQKLDVRGNYVRSPPFQI